MSEFAVEDIKCKECPLWEGSISDTIIRSGVYGRGSGKLGLWLYGEALDGEDCRLGLPFVGDDGKILSTILREINISEDDIFITNLVRCRPTVATSRGVRNRNPIASEIKKCMETHAQTDKPSIPPKLIVCLGNAPLRAILGKQKITDNRGVIFDCDLFSCKAMATYDPGAILHSKKTNVYEIIKADLIKAKEFVLDTQEKKKVHHRILINSEESFFSWMEILSNSTVTERFCDIETTGLDFWKEKIVSISFTTEIDEEIYSIAFLTVPKPGWWYADLEKRPLAEALQNVLKNPIDFHNELFDIKFFWKEGFFVKFGVDTMDQHLMIDESSPHNLQYCVSIYNKEDDGYKQEIAGLLGEEGRHCDLPPEILLDYNNTDTYNSFLLKKKFTPIIKKEGLDGFFHRLAMPLKHSLTRMSYRGIMMDREGIINKSNEYREKIKLKREELFDKAKQKFDYSGSSKNIKKVLYVDLELPIVKRTEKGMPSTDKEAMKQLARIHEVPNIILQLRAYEYALRMYLDGNDLNEKGINPDSGMLCKLDSNDRIHGPFLSGGTISGRPSCPKPNLLNIPKNPEIRNLFIAPPGWKLIEIDYSQAELVLLAYLSGDEQFKKDVMSDDFHMATAKSLMRMDVVDGEVRRAAKAINFLKSYGGGAEKLGNSLKLQEEERYFNELKTTKKYDKVCLNQRSWYHTRVEGSVPIKYQSVNNERRICYTCEADEWLKKWDATYPRVPQYKQEQMRLWKSQGYILGLYGRKKRFPQTFTKEQESYHDRISINYMCQNGVSETVNRSLVDIDYELDLIFGWHPHTLYQVPGIVLAVYDSIMCEAPDEMVPDVKELMVELMSIPVPQLNISLKCDVTISQRWGEKLEEKEDILDIDEVAEMNI